MNKKFELGQIFGHTYAIKELNNFNLQIDNIKVLGFVSKQIRQTQTKILGRTRVEYQHVSYIIEQKIMFENASKRLYITFTIENDKIKKLCSFILVNKGTSSATVSYESIESFLELGLFIDDIRRSLELDKTKNADSLSNLRQLKKIIVSTVQNS